MIYPLTTDSAAPNESVITHEMCTYVRIQDRSGVGAFVVTPWSGASVGDSETIPAGEAYEFFAPHGAGNGARIPWGPGTKLGEVSAVSTTVPLKQTEAWK